jgi:hypothetical protein
MVAVSCGGGMTVPVRHRLDAGIDFRLLHLFSPPPEIERFIVPAGTLGTARIGARIGFTF